MIYIEKPFLGTSILRHLFLLSFVALGWLGTAQQEASAASINVSTVTDELSTNGNCSLREAITNANNDDQSGSTDCSAGTGDDAIYVPAGTYVLDKVGHSEDANSTGDLDIWSTYALEIIGSGVGITIIDGNGMGSTPTDDTDNVFHVAEGDVTFQDLTVQNAGISASVGEWSGVFMENISSAYFNNVEVIDNQGNGLYVHSLVPTILSIEASQFSNNGDRGAKIAPGDYSTLNIKNTDMNQNGYEGLDLDGEFLSVSIDQSHFDNNYLGFTTRASSSTIEITNSSFQSNSTDGLFSVANATTTFSISDSIFNDNGEMGLESLSSQMSVENSSFNNNDGNGIYFFLGTIAIIDLSELSNNGGSGIYTISDADNGSGWIKLTVTKSSIAGNSDSGIKQRGDYTTLELKNSAISNNTAEHGGGIYSTGGTIVISDSFITNNEAEKSGGGVWHQDRNDLSDDYEETLYIENTEISDNTAQLGAGGIYVEGLKKLGIDYSILEKNTVSNGSGGGLWIASSLESLISFSTFDSNQASIGSGGGVYNYGNGVLSIDSSTISNNKATNKGGGIYNLGEMDFLTSTMSANKALNGPGLYNASGGKLVNIFNSTLYGNSVEIISGKVSVKSTIVQTSNLTGTVVSLGYNIDQGNTWKFTRATDKKLTYAKLGALTNNGGPTKTHALLSGSPAIDTGNSTTIYDQRGVGYARKVDGNGDGVTVPDIGAYEYVFVLE